MMPLVAPLHEMGNKDFRHKWFVVEGMALLVKEKYVQTIASPAWHA